MGRQCMHSNPMPISKKVQGIPEALSVYFNQLVYELKKKQRDIITLSLGEAFFKYPIMIFNSSTLIADIIIRIVWAYLNYVKKSQRIIKNVIMQIFKQMT